MTAERDEWRAGGSMLMAAAICYALVVCPVNALGPLIQPLEAAFGWSRAAITSTLMLSALGSIVMGPVAGHVCDRFGARRTAKISVPILAGAMLLISLSGPTMVSWYACWLAFALIQPFAGSVIWTNAVISRFDRSRGMALAVVLSGTAAVHALLPSVVVTVVEAWNWRAVFLILAGVTLVIGWPLTWHYLYSARDSSSREATEKTAWEATQRRVSARALREAMRTRQFWQLAGSFFAIAFALSSLYVHFLPILIHAGFSSLEAARIAMAIGPAGLLGRFLTGYCLDRLPATVVTATTVLLLSIAYAMLMVAGSSIASAMACAVLLGFVLGAATNFMSYLVSRYFGQHSYGALYGLLFGCFTVGYAVSPVLTARAFDASRSYEASFSGLLWVALVAAVLIATLGPAANCKALRPPSP